MRSEVLYECWSTSSEMRQTRAPSHKRCRASLLADLFLLNTINMKDCNSWNLSVKCNRDVLFLSAFAERSEDWSIVSRYGSQNGHNIIPAITYLIAAGTASSILSSMTQSHKSYSAVSRSISLSSTRTKPSSSVSMSAAFAASSFLASPTLGCFVSGDS